MSAYSYQCFFTYFGLRENPFHVSPDPRFYHSTPAHDSAMNELLFGVQSKQGLSILTGEAGTGKTSILNAILESLEQRSISTSYVFHSVLEPEELLEFILRDFGVPYRSPRRGDLVHTLHLWLIERNNAGDSPVLIVDEAQSLSLETLDELRLLLNLESPRGKLLQVILAGQSELEEKLRRPELRQLRQRVVFHCKLPVFSEPQTTLYVQSRLAAAGFSGSDLFPPETLKRIHLHSRGIPRVINLICEHALITAYGEQQQTISTDIIQRIAVDFDLSAKPISLQQEYVSGTFGRRLIEFPPTDPRLAPPVADEPDREKVQEIIEEELVAAASEMFREKLEVAPAALLQPKEPVFQLQELATPTGDSNARFLWRAASSFKLYWREVGESFVSDCRHWCRPIAVARSANAGATSAAMFTGPGNGVTAQQNPFQPIANWLRQPMASHQIPDPRRAARSSPRK